ncbi:MAG: helix-turn-helix domain-containing protein, partial [bacterium]|nr:helix-turn-helix domain-containing protein [bacterium]
GHFREDLYFRLNVVNVDIPPLRDHKEDIPLLARYFFNKYTQSMSRPIKDISSDAMQQLVNYKWPGNVRELRNVIEHAIVICDGEVITPQDLSFPFSVRSKRVNGDSLEEVEKAHIEQILNRNNWQISRVAEILKIDRTTLYNKIKKYNLSKSM